MYVDLAVGRQSRNPEIVGSHVAVWGTKQTIARTSIARIIKGTSALYHVLEFPLADGRAA